MEKQERTFPELDLSILLGDGLYAVHCRNEEEAAAFVHAMIREYPDKCVGWDEDHVRWDVDYDKYGGGMAYYPDINYAEGDDLMHGSVNYGLENGFEMIEFDELIGIEDMMDVGDMSIEELLEII